MEDAGEEDRLCMYNVRVILDVEIKTQAFRRFLTIVLLGN